MLKYGICYLFSPEWMYRNFKVGKYRVLKMLKYGVCYQISPKVIIMVFFNIFSVTKKLKHFKKQIKSNKFMIFFNNSKKVKNCKNSVSEIKMDFKKKLTFSGQTKMLIYGFCYSFSPTGIGVARARPLKINKPSIHYLLKLKRLWGDGKNGHKIIFDRKTVL